LKSECLREASNVAIDLLVQTTGTYAIKLCPEFHSSSKSNGHHKKQPPLQEGEVRRRGYWVNNIDVAEIMAERVSPNHF
jgi:hypothetical protein